MKPCVKLSVSVVLSVCFGAPVVPWPCGSGALRAADGETGAVQHLVLFDFFEEATSRDVRQAIYNAAVDGDSNVVLKLRSPVPEDAYLCYGTGRDPICNLVDEEDMAAPVFGSAEIER